MTTATSNLPYLQRPCFRVQDIDRSLTIYRDLLGFTVEYVMVDDPDTYIREVFPIPEGIETRFATLSTPTQVRSLAMVEAKGIEVNPSPASSTVVIKVPSVDKTMAAAAEMGLRCAHIIEVGPNDGPGQGRKEAVFFDFDNNPVVVFELLS